MRRILVLMLLITACSPNAAPSETTASTTTQAPATSTSTTAAAPGQTATSVAAVSYIPVRIRCSAELAAHPCGRLIDGWRGNGWQAPDGGIDASITFWFDEPFQLTEVGFTNLDDAEQFLRNARIKGLEIAVDDLSQATIGELNDTNAVTEWIPVRSVQTSIVTITIRSAYPGVSVGDLTPFSELALAEVQFRGVPLPQSTAEPSEQSEPPLDLNALAEILYIDEAEHLRIEAAIHACMNELGFEYNDSPYWPWDMFDGAPWRAVVNPPPEIGPTQAEQDAYQEERRRVSDSQVGWNDGFFGTDTETITVEGGGTLIRPIGGCLDQGQATVVGDTSAWATLLERTQAIVGRSWSAAEDTPEIETAAEAWASCMQSRGYNATSLDEGEDWGTQQGADAAFADCMVESGYSAAIDTVRHELVGPLLREAPGLAALVSGLTPEEQ